MAKKIPKRELARLGARKHRGRTDLYRYLRRNMPALLAQGFGTDAGPAWSELVLTLSRAGHTNRVGGSLTPQGVRRVFVGVREDLAREQAEAAARPIPGRVGQAARVTAPPDWRPTPISPPLEAPRPALNVNGMTEEEAEADADEQLARLRRHIDERSGRKRT